MSTRAQVVKEAHTWIGTPYHHHARIKGVGVDCVQLLCGVFEACGLVPHVDTGFYPVDWHLHRSEELFVKALGPHATQLQPAAPRAPGDVFLFRYGRTFSHGAIYVGDDSDGHGLLVHSYIGRGVILSGFHEEPLAGRVFQHWSVFE
jgi:NlpC/P60 family putative phage cell wall peptidase